MPAIDAASVYEYPLNERLRTLLRLEQLFDRLEELLERDTPTDHHFALLTLFEVLDVTNPRSELRQDLLKDLGEHLCFLQPYVGDDQFDQTWLTAMVKHLQSCRTRLESTTNQTSKALLEKDAWLAALRGRIHIPGGTTPFDFPQYHAWLRRSVEQRRQDLRNWIDAMDPLPAAVALVLQRVRDSAITYDVLAKAGRFSQPFPEDSAPSLVRLLLDPATGMFPETTANRLRIAVRMMQLSPEIQVIAVDVDTPFQIQLCA
ncbi:cell division protein ZapD [Candidatus Symbiobacter mobilis]|uniref:Cell division protein ZapD n=1 Tax=Candidatus Symbiobacter mobilis CR TaxID=946483 RepID=U5N772_9BURK|nr:cell division protein ZapD [Candidatus Symbiobacter mobilis]AGX87155.1 hypothetical protein Cenrod_1061 [Candidatus Symbiobacter mobilis CR]